jgi:hypothetical protein
MAFSVGKNLRELLAELPAEGDINCIYGVRALCTIAVYLAHKVITLASSPYFNRVKLTEVTGHCCHVYESDYRLGLIWYSHLLTSCSW